MLMSHSIQPQFMQVQELEQSHMAQACDHEVSKMEEQHGYFCLKGDRHLEQIIRAPLECEWITRTEARYILHLINKITYVKAFRSSHFINSQVLVQKNHFEVFFSIHNLGSTCQKIRLNRWGSRNLHFKEPFQGIVRLLLCEPHFENTVISHSRCSERSFLFPPSVSEDRKKPKTIV